jgi:amidase
MLRISKENHIHAMSAENLPCVKIESGTRLIVDTWDALEGSTFIEEGQLKYTSESEVQPNPSTGPIYIEGAKPGDMIEVEIHDIALEEKGYLNFKKHMIMTEDTEEEVLYVQVDIQDGKLLYDGRQLPAGPMIGVIGTAPEKEMSCREAGDHGGNMDCRLIKKGSKVWLPVFVEGGLLALGDVHAAMGDGEVFGQGIEVGASIDITVTIKKGLNLPFPIIILEDRFACIGSSEDMHEASYMAVRNMGQYLVKVLGFTYKDACAAIAFYGNLVICQVVNKQKTVRMEIRKEFAEAFIIPLSQEGKRTTVQK